MYQSRLLQASLTGMRTWCRPVMGGNASSTTLPVGTPEGLSTDPSLPITLELAEHQGGKRLGYSPFQNRSHPDRQMPLAKVSGGSPRSRSEVRSSGVSARVRSKWMSASN